MEPNSLIRRIISEDNKQDKTWNIGSEVVAKRVSPSSSVALSYRGLEFKAALAKLEPIFGKAENVEPGDDWPCDFANFEIIEDNKVCGHFNVYAAKYSGLRDPAKPIYWHIGQPVKITPTELQQSQTYIKMLFNNIGIEVKSFLGKALPDGK